VALIGLGLGAWWLERRALSVPCACGVCVLLCLFVHTFATTHDHKPHKYKLKISDALGCVIWGVRSSSTHLLLVILRTSCADLESPA
jgi:hypothetical protein